MQHIHFQNIKSTQKYLIENYNNKPLLISTSNQSQGVGRSGNDWDHYKNGLAFSFSLTPLKPATLTPLEIGTSLCNFLKKKHGIEIGVKWPNDLMTKEGEKCGGIICNYLTPKIIIVGVGLNWGSIEKYLPFDSIFPSKKLSSKEYKEIPAQISQFILDNRLNCDQLISQWIKLCIHFNKEVTIKDGEDEKKGIFTGLGSNGEAILNHKDTFLAGSLFF